MSDEDLRRLERALAADPSDAVALERLATALSRVGRGWYGEPLPPDLVPSKKERNIYLYYRNMLCLEMVYVPGDKGTSVWTTTNPDGTRRAHSAFYIGRHAVTRGEWMDSGLSCQTSSAEADLTNRAYWSRKLKHLPVTNVSYENAQEFCDRIDLRLPNRAELARAVGGSVPEFGFRVALTGKHESKRLGRTLVDDSTDGTTTTAIQGAPVTTAKCQEIHDDLELRALRLLEDEEAGTVEAHANECATCRARLAALREVVADPQTWEEPPPVDPARQAQQRAALVAYAKAQKRWIAAGDYEIWHSDRDGGSFWVEPPPPDGSRLTISYEAAGGPVILADVEVQCGGRLDLSPEAIEAANDLRSMGTRFWIVA